MTKNNITPLRPKRDCPQCDKPYDQAQSHEAYPFCSQRCSDLDLGNWLNGNYRIAARNNDESDFSSSFNEAEGNHADKGE
jgi:endogenous inhibitor of DNA gyrase (YacG/DUF329 family)